MPEIGDDLDLTGPRGQQECSALPVREGHAETREDQVGDLHPIDAFAAALDRAGVARIDTRPRDRVSPMFVASKHAAERTHVISFTGMISGAGRVARFTSPVESVWRSRRPSHSS